MKFDEVPPALTTAVRIVALKDGNSLDGSLVISFGHSLTGNETEANYHSAVFIPSAFADAFRTAIARTKGDNVPMYIAPTTIGSS